MKKFRLDLSPPKRLLVLLLLYASELAASLWLAYELRFDFTVDAASRQERYFVLLWLVPLQLVFLGLFHQLTPLLGYFSTPDLGRVFHALTISSIIAAIIWGVWGTGFAGNIPTGFVVIRSPNELDVVAVYTVERPDQPVMQLEIKTIAPRVIQTDQEMCRDQPPPP